MQAAYERPVELDGGLERISSAMIMNHLGRPLRPPLFTLSE